jgi:hypothetical protein
MKLSKNPMDEILKKLIINTNPSKKYEIVKEIAAPIIPHLGISNKFIKMFTISETEDA